MPVARGEVKSSWADQVEEGDDFLPSLPPITEVTENGIKTITEYKYNENGKRVKIVRQYKIETRVVSSSIAKRKQWKKFGEASSDKPGPNPANTIVGEEMQMQFITGGEDDQPKEEDPLAKIKGQKMVKCRICQEDHWTTQCPYKDTLLPLKETLKGIDNPSTTNADAEQPPQESAKPSGGGAQGGKTGKYVAPSLRDGANRGKGESMMTKGKDDVATVRVTNLSEDTCEADLEDLFQPFGKISRIYLAKYKGTNQSKGFAFINYDRREDAAKAIAAVSGFAYDHLILKVEWAK